MPLSIRPVAYGSAEYISCVDLRRAILRTPLGLDFTAAQLATEAGDIHLAAFEDEILIGTVILSVYDDTTIKLRQMAVDAAARGKGIGARLLAAAETHTRNAGRSRIILAARLTAQVFYARNGYRVEGGVFEEVTLPHIRMQKVIT